LVKGKHTFELYRLVDDALCNDSLIYMCIMMMANIILCMICIMCTQKTLYPISEGIWVWHVRLVYAKHSICYAVMPIIWMTTTAKAGLVKQVSELSNCSTRLDN
jgi:hypothetical protein